VPLSEHEQRILQEIERHLAEEDPTFAGKVRRHAPRLSNSDRAKLGAVTFVAGLAILIAFFFLRSIIAGVVAFGAMVTGIVMVTGSVRRVAAENRDRRARWLDTFRRWSERVRERYRRT
jgi:uncharacterized membrane protein YedE/YeeE